MAGNGRVFISHSHDDNARCAPLLAAMEAWGVDYFFDTQGLGAGQQLNETIQREIATRDVFLRVCTAATQRSFWMSLEVSAFRGLQAEDQRRGRGSQRLLINLILDGDYTREPFDNATLFIDAASRPRPVWMAELGRALNVSAPRAQRPKVSRREVVAYGAAAAVTLSSTAAAGALFLDYRSHTQGPVAQLPKYLPGKPVWTIPNASPKKDIPTLPVVGGNTLYLLSVADVTAYDIGHVTNGTPKKLWSQTITPKQTIVSPAVYGSVLYLGIDSTLYALNAHNGTKIWTVDLPADDNGIDSGALLVNGVIYIFSQTGRLYTFRAKDGSQVWNDVVDATAYLLDHASGPAVDGDSVFIGSLDHNIYALNAKDGSQRWKVLTRGPVISTPAVVNGTVYIGSGDNYVYALNTKDGSVRWKYLTGEAVNSSPAVVDGVVYVASDDHYLYTLDAETGKPYWRAPIGDLDASTGIIEKGGPVTCQPAIAGDAVCVMDDLNFVVRSYSRSDGESRWTYASKSGYENADPLAANGLILFGSGDQTLYAFGA
ncbi:MAG: hypothetical protein OJF49_001173 [Ktedonobacterales bacterium]|jgi:outer membrane protein assembly factor BamB|nr:MAG: hypothetical protein OJF49_001173 [Ktedonobacterales bacterium]